MADTNVPKFTIKRKFLSIILIISLPLILIYFFSTGTIKTIALISLIFMMALLFSFIIDSWYFSETRFYWNASGKEIQEHDAKQWQKIPYFLIALGFFLALVYLWFGVLFVAIGLGNLIQRKAIVQSIRDTKPEDYKTINQMVITFFALSVFYMGIRSFLSPNFQPLLSQNYLVEIISPIVAIAIMVFFIYMKRIKTPKKPNP